MSASSSDARLKQGFASAIVGLAVSASAFYWMQSSGLLPGGPVAPIKLGWLACTILFWYLVPALLLLDRRMPAVARRACKVLLVNMLLRGVIELYLMYVAGQWHPWIGIGHDLFSLLLMLFVLSPWRNAENRLYSGYLLVASALYIPEAIFAWYMLTYATAPGSTVYFVPDDPAHRGILIATWVCVTLLLAYLAYFSRRWLYGQTDR